jgi:fused signal recognition particle receptor
MFGKLKDKLKNWAKKFSEEAPSEEVEDIIEEKPKKEKSSKKSEKKKEKPSKEKETKKTPEKTKIEKTSKTKISSEQKQKVPASQDEVVDTKEAKEELKEEFERKKETIKSKDKNRSEDTTDFQKESTKRSILSFFKKQIPEKAPKQMEGEKILQSEQKIPSSQDEVVDTPESKEILEEELSSKNKGFFKKLTERIQKVKINEEDFEVYGEELEMLLLENNVALEVTEKIINDLKQKLLGREILKKEMESEIEGALKDSVYEILVEPFLIKDKINEKKLKSEEPYVILFCGINGTGKTTTIAKIADQLKREGFNPVLAAGDTFRSAAIDQIKKHGEKLNIPVIASQYGADPASVGFDAIQYAKKNHKDVVLIDTAGRMHTDKNLLKEIEKIAKITKADTKIFVGESITGNDAIEQVRSFNFAIGIDGIILTKADIDEKGGTALSVGFVTKKPILYLGTGQEYDKIEPFNKNKFIESLGLN